MERAAIECGEYSGCRDVSIEMFEDPEKFYKIPVRVPDLVIMFRTQANNFEELETVKATARMLIPSIAIVDSNCDPRLITYPVPANDDTPCSIALFARLFKEAILLGKMKRKELIRQNGAKNKSKKISTSSSINSLPDESTEKTNESTDESATELSKG